MRKGEKDRVGCEEAEGGSKGSQEEGVVVFDLSACLQCYFPSRLPGKFQ